MLMIDGPLQLLFYALPPNSKRLVSETGNAPLFEDFEGPIGPQGLVISKIWIKQNVITIWLGGGGSFL